MMGRWGKSWRRMGFAHNVAFATGAVVAKAMVAERQD
jgi:hypothetical protein